MYHCIVLLNFFARGWRTKLGPILLARWCKQCRNFWRVGTKNYRKRKGWRKVKGVSKKKKREEINKREGRKGGSILFHNGARAVVQETMMPI